MFRAQGSGTSSPGGKTSASGQVSKASGSHSVVKKEARKPSPSGESRLGAGASGGRFFGKWQELASAVTQPSIQPNPSLLSSWYSPSVFPLGMVSEPDSGTPVPTPEEEKSLLKGSGVAIASQPEGWAGTRYGSLGRGASGGITTSFRTKLMEVSGLPEQAPVAAVEPEIPVATPVRGKPGFVELTFDPRGLPYIDVRGLQPGAEVQIVDPLDVSKTIRFRIPEPVKTAEHP